MTANANNPESYGNTAPMQEDAAHTAKLTADLKAIAAETNLNSTTAESYSARQLGTEYSKEANTSANAGAGVENQQTNITSEALGNNGQPSPEQQLAAEKTKIYENASDDPAVQKWREDISRLTQQGMTEMQDGSASSFDKREYDSSFAGGMDVRDRVTRRVVLQQTNAFLRQYPEKAAAYRNQIGALAEAFERKELQEKRSQGQSQLATTEGRYTQPENQLAQQGPNAEPQQNQEDQPDQEQLTDQQREAQEQQTRDEFEAILDANPDLREKGWNAETMARHENLKAAYESLQREFEQRAVEAQRGIAKVEQAMSNNAFNLKLLFHPELADPETGQPGLDLDASEGRELAIFSKSYALETGGASASVDTLNDLFLKNMKLNAEHYRQGASDAREFLSQAQAQLQAKSGPESTNQNELSQARG